jgi:hypothetical protein
MKKLKDLRGTSEEELVSSKVAEIVYLEAEQNFLRDAASDFPQPVLPCQGLIEEGRHAGTECQFVEAVPWERSGKLRWELATVFTPQAVKNQSFMRLENDKAWLLSTAVPILVLMEKIGLPSFHVKIRIVNKS